MQDLYKKNCQCIIQIEEMILFYRQQNYYKGNIKEKEVLEDFSNIITLSLERGLLENSAINDLLNPLLNAKENQDYILLADLYEFQIIPFLLYLQEQVKRDNSQEYWEQNINALQNDILKKELLLSERKDNDIKYFIEDTNIGGKTLRLEQGKNTWYLHSNGNPWKEAMIFAEEYYDENKTQYAIWGLGLGYHVEQLWKKSKYNQITIFEENWEIIKLAFRYHNLAEMLSSGRIQIVYDPTWEKLSTFLKGFEGDFLIHAPSLKHIKDEKKKDFLEEYFMQWTSVNNQISMLKQNFNQNKQSFKSFADDLCEKWRGKEIILIAGGPSLDNELKNVRKLREGKILLAVGTVLKKLIKENVKPDYAIITDAKDSMIEQVQEVDTKEIPLLYLSTVSPEVLKFYKGKQYCILQKGFGYAEEYAQKANLEIYETGGSVSTTALELAIRLGQKKIYCFGLDLAYTEEKTHAEGTAGCRTADVSGMRKVRSVTGQSVNTIKNLNSYRHWIERRIEKEKTIEFVNISHGAYIKGMKNQLTLEV